MSNNTAMQSLPPLRLGPKRIAQEIKRCLKVNLVPIVKSSPGLGKSDVNMAIAAAANLKYVDIRLSTCDVTDVNGMPHFYTDAQGNMRVMYVPFGIFPLKGDPLPINEETGKPYNGWYINFDELLACNKDLQAASYKIILDRKVGEHNLHESCWIVACGNLKSDKAVVYETSTALQSRMIHLEMEVNKNDWIDWAIDKDVDPRMIAYIEFQPQKLHVFDPNHTDHTFACPRTWWFANLLTKGQSLSIVNDLPILAGTISQQIAMEYIEFTKIFDTVPKLADIVAAPATTPVPTEHSVCYATAIMLVDLIDKKNVDAVIEYLRRFPVEALVLAVRLLCKKQQMMTMNPAVKEVMREFVNPRIT